MDALFLSDTAARMTDPIARFAELYASALDAATFDATAMALATATPDGRPSVRMVLLKGFDHRGFVFYTNLESRKAGELTANPRAALCFHWPELQIQVRVEGRVEQVGSQEADAYFATRARGSQVGAWASQQSRPMRNPDDLATRVQEVEARYRDVDIPRPHFWSGYRLEPERIEFWSGKPDRLHERDVYVREPETRAWRVERLYP